MDYKEKLKLAKEALDSGSYDKETIEYIFPELRESEDEKIRNLIYCLIRDRNDNGKLLEHNGCSVEKALAWLEKQGEQEPSWSEEDEEKLNSIIEVLGDNSLLVQWLKSLKPNHWKPSEEQMEALKKRTHGLHASSGTRKAIESLINDLEKL